jgi:TonB family protein
MRVAISSVLAAGLLMAAAVSAQAPLPSGSQAPANQAPATQTPTTPPATQAPSNQPAAVPDLVMSTLPVYPPAAVSSKVQGLVELRITVAPDGQVPDARVVTSIPALDQSALDAVRQWRFMPSAAGARDVLVRVSFVLSPFPADPPSTAAAASDPAGRIQWIPRDFEFVYRYRCRAGEVQLGTIDNKILVYRGDQPETLPLNLSLDDKQRLFLAMVARGFFAAPSAETTNAPAAGIRALNNAYEVTVIGQTPGSATETVRLELPSTRRRRSDVSVHRLEARQFGTWRAVKWQEPVSKSDQETQGLATLGKMIRDIALPKTEDKKLKEAQCR